jgi:hypothetical protein
LISCFPLGSNLDSSIPRNRESCQEAPLVARGLLASSESRERAVSVFERIRIWSVDGLSDSRSGGRYAKLVKCQVVLTGLIVS